MFYIVRDPAVHQIVDVPVVHALRRDTGFQNLVVYKHAEHGRFVLAFQSIDQGLLWELGYVDGQDGQGHVPDRPTYQGLVRSLKRDWQTPGEQKKALRAWETDYCRERNESQAAYEDAMEALNRTIRKEHGAAKADEHWRATGLTRKHPDVITGATS